MECLPDLLYPDARPPADQERRVKELAFAFTTGDSSGDLGKILDRAVVPGSSWEPSCFADDLFVDEFVEECLKVSWGEWVVPLNKSFIKAVLCHPPDDPEAVRFRQDIQRELAGDDRLRADLQACYQQLLELRMDLDANSDFGRSYFFRWRLDILVRVHRVVEQMAGSFEGTGSGLERIRRYAREVRETRGFRNLVELLDYEDEMATVGLRLRLGADGKVRGFEIENLSENERNPYHVGPVRRFLNRWSLILRGYRVTGEELIARWVERVFEQLVEDLVPLLQLIGDMEFYLASLHFRDLCEARGLPVCLPELTSGDGAAGRTTAGLFNPLLLNLEEPPIPCDVRAERGDSIVILTGPNSGGKTRLLQALAWQQLLGQAGFHTNAAAARLRPATALFVSLNEAPRADQPEGRLGMELLRIRRLFETSRVGALVVLDELCSGTNPSEGEEIFLLVVTLLRELSPEAFVSTHFLSFAQELEQQGPVDGLQFIQVQLDEQQRPTFQFGPGVATTSLAGPTAKRLGVTRGELQALIDAARKG